ncbi:hypothetical protein EYF80_026717 [Liparis tanakae]|uniref:Uncharacterized protein n=1 Tax=Liparis tanakae TaxID=230148 RepID=A0A4Z2HBU5_9TELE|nr:hypothetical protein EYF80_026717 [Liparis tanakae]
MRELEIASDNRRAHRLYCSEAVPKYPSPRSPLSYRHEANVKVLLKINNERGGEVGHFLLKDCPLPLSDSRPERKKLQGRLCEILVKERTT